MDLLDDAEPALDQGRGAETERAPYQYTLAAAKVGKRQFEAAQRARGAGRKAAR